VRTAGHLVQTASWPVVVCSVRGSGSDGRVRIVTHDGKALAATDAFLHFQSTFPI